MSIHNGTLSGVSTTGIYCRSTCAAKPLKRNVTSYSTSVAAEAAGFRPCLRCRPDRLPEPHLPTVAPPAVAHALVLIADGYLDRHTEDALARSAGYSGRQLRRLFLKHVGASPAFVARSRRAHFARRLLDETDLALSAVATTAGYGSTRQLHRAVTSTFAFSPSELRAKRRRSLPMIDDGGIPLRIPYREPLDLNRLRKHLGPRAIPGVEHLDERGVYRRSFEACGHEGLLDIDLSSSDDQAASIKVVAHLPTMVTLLDDVARCRHLLGLDQAAAIAKDLANDPTIGPEVTARPGLRIPGCWDRFEALIRIVVGQQVSVKGASTMTGRLATAAGRSIGGASTSVHTVFPAPDVLAEADLNGLGFTERRISTIKAVSEAVAGGALDLFRFASLDDLIAGYCELPGIGPWTAHLAAMRLHRHGDAFPSSDSGVRKGAAILTGAAKPIPAKELEALADQWRPNRSLVAQVLWAIANEGRLT